MKNFLAGILFLLIMLVYSPNTKGQSCYFDFQYMQYSEFTGNYLIFNDPFDDTTFLNVPIGFNYRYGGNTWTTVSVNSNGQVLLGGNPSSNDTLYSIIPFGVDLFGDVYNHNPAISYQCGGCAGALVMKIQFKDLSFKNGTAEDYVNFQVWLYESTGGFEFHYGPSHASDIFTCFEGNSGPMVGTKTSKYNQGTILGSLLLTGFTFAPDISTSLLPSYLDGIPEESQLYYFEVLSTTGIATQAIVNHEPYISNESGSEYIDLHLFPNKKEVFNICIFDTSGKKFVESKYSAAGPGEEKVRIPATSLNSGTWLLRLSSSTQTSILRFILP
jgi:hypothetical protein